MRKVYKYPVSSINPCICQMPYNAEILSVHVQYNNPCIWALVDPYEELVDREIYVYGTGHDVPDHVINMQYVGTFLLSDGNLVFHVWAKP